MLELLSSVGTHDHPHAIDARRGELVEHVADQRQVRDCRAVARALSTAAPARVTAGRSVDDREAHQLLLPVRADRHCSMSRMLSAMLRGYPATATDIARASSARE